MAQKHESDFKLDVSQLTPDEKKAFEEFVRKVVPDGMSPAEFLVKATKDGRATPFQYHSREERVRVMAMTIMQKFEETYKACSQEKNEKKREKLVEQFGKVFCDYLLHHLEETIACHEIDRFEKKKKDT